MNTQEDSENQDIRGHSFRKEDCKNGKFIRSKAGIKPFFLYILVILFLFLSILISSAIAIAIIPVLAGITPFLIPSLIGLSILGVFLFFLVTKGFTGALLAEGIVTIFLLISIIPLLIVGEHTVVPGVFFGILSTAVALGGIVMFAFTITVLHVLCNQWIKYAAIITSTAILVTSIPVIFPRNNKPPHQFDCLIGITLTVIILIVGFHIATCSLQRDERFGSIRLAAIAFCSRCYSTSFREANLTNADFSGSTLRNVDFIKANLTMTRFQDAKDIEYAYLDENLGLQNPKVQRLAITQDVNKLSNKNFDYLDLEGINLESANLRGVSFIGANLKNANLKNADLSEANLKQIHLAGANLTGACLTGACIEDWGITRSTVLKEIKCKYIYLEYKEESDKNGHLLDGFEKKFPNDGEFKEEEFIERAYHSWEQYEENKKTTYGFTANITNYGEVHMSDDRGSMHISNVRGDISGVNAVGGDQTLTGAAVGKISGSVSNVVNQLPSAPNPDQPSIKELLAELQAAIESDADLPDKGKVTALENVKILAEVAQNPEQLEKKNLGNQAINFFKGAASFLPDTAKLVEACSKLLPLITKALGLPF